MKPKNLIGIPWRVAFALQADGWWLRQDIIWAKPNPMPESVTSRCTKAHEYVFLLAKSANYYYDNDAVKEEAIGEFNNHKRQRNSMNGKDGITQRGGKDSSTLGLGWAEPTRNRRSVWTVTTQPYRGAHFAVMPEALVEPCLLAGSRPGDVVLDPFCGSGTTGVVAGRLNRRFVGLDLKRDYLHMAERRMAEVAPRLPEVV